MTRTTSNRWLARTMLLGVCSLLLATACASAPADMVPDPAAPSSATAPAAAQDAPDHAASEPHVPILPDGVVIDASAQTPAALAHQVLAPYRADGSGVHLVVRSGRLRACATDDACAHDGHASGARAAAMYTRRNRKEAAPATATSGWDEVALQRS